MIHALAKRLEGSKGEWLVTLKTLIAFHRLMREVDSTFQVEVCSMLMHEDWYVSLAGNLLWNVPSA